MNKKEETKNQSKFARFKEIWANPRYKALIKLGMYAIFFGSLFLISYISTSFREKTPVDNKTNNLILLDNYKYKYEITINNNNIKEVITYNGIETSATNSGTIEYLGLDTLHSYVVDKMTNKIYINGIEKEKLYDELYEEYLSYKSIKNIINSSTKKDNKYIYKDNVIITLEEKAKEYYVLMEFNTENKEETYIEKIILEFWAQ